MNLSEVQGTPISEEKMAELKRILRERPSTPIQRLRGGLIPGPASQSQVDALERRIEALEKAQELRR